VNVEEGCFSGTMCAVGRLVGVKWFVRSEVICEVGFNNMLLFWI